MDIQRIESDVRGSENIQKTIILRREERGSVAFYPQSGKIFRLNEMGEYILRILCQRQQIEINQIENEISKKFKVDQTTVNEDLLHFIERLQRLGIIEANASRIMISAVISEIAAKREIVSPSAGSLSSPVIICWDITTACNLKCRHCYNCSGKARDSELTTSQCLYLIDEFVDNGVFVVELSGGEPLVRPDIFEILQKLSNSALYTILFTNATLIDETTAERFSELRLLAVNVSLDGAKPETHNTFRRSKNAYERAIQGLENLRKWDIPRNVTITVHKGNIGEISDIFDICIDLGVDEVRSSLFIPIGRGQSYTDGTLDKDEVGYVKGLLDEYNQKKTNSKMMVTKFPQPYDSYASRIFGTRELCEAARSLCAIDSEGYILPCPIINEDLGFHSEDIYYPENNVKSESLSNIWRRSKILGIFREITVEQIHECSQCEFKNICGGGCRALALAYNNDFYSPDPFCKMLFRPETS